MMFQFNCPHCGYGMTSEPNRSGQNSYCPGCSQPFSIPAPVIDHAPAQEAQLPALNTRKRIHPAWYWVSGGCAALALVWFDAHKNQPVNSTNAENSPGGAETPDLVARDQFGAFSVTVIRILQGKDVFTATHSSREEEIRKRGNYVVRFELAVENNTQETRSIWDLQFNLTMQDGLVYPHFMGIPGIGHTNLLSNQKGRIDVDFEVPINSVPKALVFDARVKHKPSNTAIAVNVELDRIKIFQPKANTKAIR